MTLVSTPRRHRGIASDASRSGASHQPEELAGFHIQRLPYSSGDDRLTFDAPQIATLAPQQKAEPGSSIVRLCCSVVSTIVTVVIAMTAAVAIVLAIATHLSAKSTYTVFGHPVLTVLSGSMTPVIKTGDLVVDDPVTAKQARHLHVGQIISVRDSPGSATVVSHRVVAITTLDGQVAYITKGDANNAPDATPRPASDVIGTFSYAIPRGGYLLESLHQPLVLGLFLASPILWLLAGSLFRVARETDEIAGEQ